MFRIILTSVLLFLSTLSHSQETLKPKAINYKDSLFCWDIKQSRAILKNIVKAKYCDSISSANDSIKNTLSKIIIEKKDTIVNLKVQNLKTMDLLVKEEKKVENYKKYGKWGLLLSLLVGILLNTTF
jgi:hypothetical protein